MADSKEMMVENYHKLLQELPSSADHTALLFHLSYLFLGNFPRLQINLRYCAIETQSLFESCEILLMKCVDTSHQMVSWLLPELKFFVEENESTLTKETLERAKEWIAEIVIEVKEILNRYGEHARGVAAYTSDVINEMQMAETGTETQEIETLVKVVKDLQVELRKTLEEIGRIEAQIGQINPNRMSDLSVLFAIIPFAEAILKSISKPRTARLLLNQRAHLLAERSNLKSQQHNIEVRLNDAHLKLANKQSEKGNVQKWLHQIQQTLIKHTDFWKSVLTVLEALNDETFATDHFIEDSELKGIFLTNVDLAQEHWKAFGDTCLMAKNIFRLQDKDAYKFLKSSPPLFCH